MGTILIWHNTAEIKYEKNQHYTKNIYKNCLKTLYLSIKCFERLEKSYMLVITKHMSIEKCL